MRRYAPSAGPMRGSTKTGPDPADFKCHAVRTCAVKRCSEMKVSRHVFVRSSLQAPASTRPPEYFVVLFYMIGISVRILRQRFGKPVAATHVCSKLDRLATALCVSTCKNPSAQTRITFHQVVIE